MHGSKAVLLLRTLCHECGEPIMPQGIFGDRKAIINVHAHYTIFILKIELKITIFTGIVGENVVY